MSACMGVRQAPSDAAPRQQNRQISKLWTSDVSAVSEARFHDRAGGEAGAVARVRYSRQKEAARGCGGRGLWKFNRFSPGNRCQKRDSAKPLLLMLIDVLVLTFIWIIVARGGRYSRPQFRPPFPLCCRS